MARFFGIIGYTSAQVETSPGVFENIIVEREHKGDILRDSLRTRSTPALNDDLVLTQKLSIIADAELESIFPSMVYAIVKGTRWKVISVEFQRPRIIVSLGGVYNG